MIGYLLAFLLVILFALLCHFRNRRSRNSDDQKAVLDPSRKTILITGATNGIGRIAARKLAMAITNCELILLARSRDKAVETCAEILSVAPGTKFDIVLVDFCRLSSVVKAAEEIAKKHQRVDIVINNAGLHAFEQRITSDGFAEMTQVNHLAPFLLTNLLLNRHVLGSKARIITVASEASRRSNGFDAKRDVHDTKPFSLLGSSALYGRSKLMNIMFSLELARRLRDTDAIVNCCDPGFNVTGIGRELPFARMLESVLMALGIGDPNRGAGIIVRLAASTAPFALTSGGYFGVDNAPLKPVAPGDNEHSRRALWQVTVDALKPFYFSD